MTVVAITGHRELADAAGIRRSIKAELSTLDPPITGISALAAGADQLFADVIIELGAELNVILPGRDYADSLPAEARPGFERSAHLATSVTTLDIAEVDGAAYLAAGLAMLDHCDVLLAVWDGEPSRGEGGTADLVAAARARGIEVRVIDAVRPPEGR